MQGTEELIEMIRNELYSLKKIVLLLSVLDAFLLEISINKLRMVWVIFSLFSTCFPFLLSIN